MIGDIKKKTAFNLINLKKGYVIFFLVLLLFILTFLPDYLLYVVNLFLVNSIMVISLTIVVGYTNQVSLGHASFMGIGAYLTAILGYYFHGVLLSITLSGVLLLLVGIIVGIPTTRLTGVYLAVATMALGWALPEILLKFPELTGGYAGIGIEKSTFLGLTLSNKTIYIVTLISTLIIYWVTDNFLNSFYGRAFKTLKTSSPLALAFGINVGKYRLVAFVYSVLLAGIAGTMYAHLVGYLTPHDFGFTLSLNILIAVVIGGKGSLVGAFLGALFITLVPELTSSAAVNLPPIILGTAMLIALLFFPRGLAGIIVRGKGETH